MASTAFSMCAFASLIDCIFLRHYGAGTGSTNLPRTFRSPARRYCAVPLGNQRPHLLSAQRAQHGPMMVNIEHDDREVVVLAERDRGRIHHAELAAQHILERQVGDEL